MKDRLITIATSVAATMGLLQVAPERMKELDVDRLIVRKELIVSDTGSPWEQGFEAQQVARGIYAKSVGDGIGGLWVRSRLIKTEIDDPFDDRFHAINRDKSMFWAPGHISWNVWIDDNWRQMALIQGEGPERSVVPLDQWRGGNHPGRLRFQSFRPNHGEPLTDALIGQGKMSLGGGGYGGGGLPDPTNVLELWGGSLRQNAVDNPDPPVVVEDDGTGHHEYSLIALGPQGARTAPSSATTAGGLAKLRWDSVPGADAYIVVRDGKNIAGPLRIEGSQKEWTDKVKP
jgi:hypothetical protein